MKKNLFPIIEEIINKLNAYDFDGAIITSSDPHCNEYPAKAFLLRSLLIGFNGSAGTIVFYKEKKRMKVGLFVDGRYHLEAYNQFKESGITLFFLGNEGVFDPINHLLSLRAYNKRIYIDGLTVSVLTYTKWKEDLAKGEIKLSSHPLLDDYFSCLRANAVFSSKSPYLATAVYTSQKTLTATGELFSYQSLLALSKKRVAMLKMVLMQRKLDAILISNMEEIAWLLSLRGFDILYNSLFYSYLLITKKKIYLYLLANELSKKLLDYCKDLSIFVSSYPYDFTNFLPQDIKLKKIALDYGYSSQALKEQLESVGIEPIYEKEFYKSIEIEKALRSDVQLSYLFDCLKIDGVALFKLYNWIEKRLSVSKKDSAPTEEEVSAQMDIYRRESCNLILGDGHYIGPSFETISCCKENGAIVHYRPCSNRALALNEPFLIDTGGLFLWATTDITRLFYFSSKLNNYSDFALLKKIYTLVVKGHIDLATLEFPVGTRGAQLDSIARVALWDAGLNYNHSTGHGVGAGLNVHQGPHSISATNDVILKPNMIVTNEPGCYLAKQFGVRFENIMLVVKSSKEGFLRFKTLSLFPLEQKLIEPSLLTKKHRDWICDYHKRIYKELSLFLNRGEKAVLKKQCKGV